MKPHVPLTLDGWASALTGMGLLGKDKAESATFLRGPRLSYELLDAVYAGDAIAARMVDVLPDDMMRQGYAVQFGDAREQPLDPKTVGQWQSKWTSWCTQVQLHKHVKRHFKQARAYGSSLLVLGVDDSQPLDQPLRENSLRQFDSVVPLDCSQVTPGSERETNPASPWFGQPLLYHIHAHPQLQASVDAAHNLGVINSLAEGMTIHTSRLWRTDGVMVSERMRELHGGWGVSVIERAWEPLRNFNTAMKSAGTLMHDFAQGVYHIKGLREIVSAHKQDLIARWFQIGR